MSQVPIPRIVYFCPATPGDDPNIFMAALWLYRRGYQVTFICGGQESIYNSPCGAIPVLPLARGQGQIQRLLWHLRAAWVLFKYRWTDSISIFYLQRSESTASGFLGLMFLPSRRLVYHTQDYLEPGRFRMWAWLERHVARRAGWVIVNEPNRARFMASSYRLRRAPTVVRTALPRDWPIPTFDPALREKIVAGLGKERESQLKLVMHQGTFTKVRCSEEVLDAMTLLPRHFVLICTGLGHESPAFEEWDARVRGRGLQDRTIYLPRLPFNDLLRITACCDVGLLLYPNDGVGNFYQAPGRLTQYMGCGIPIVTSNFPGLELLTLKYKIGLACDPGQPAEIASAIQVLGDRHQAERDQDRIRLRTLAKGLFAYDTEAVRIEEILALLVQESIRR